MSVVKRIKCTLRGLSVLRGAKVRGVLSVLNI